MRGRYPRPEFGSLRWWRSIILLTALFYATLAGSVAVFSWLFLPEAPK